MQRMVHIPRHAAGVTTHIDTGAVLQPGKEFLAMFKHAVLHVNLLFLVPRKRRFNPSENAVAPQRFQFISIEKIGLGVLLAEEKPALAARTGRLALLQEGAEWRDAGAGPNHDQSRIRRRWAK